MICGVRYFMQQIGMNISWYPQQKKMQHGNGIQVITRVKHMRNSLKRTKTCWIVPYFVWCIIMHRVIWKECICKPLPQSWDVDGKWRGRCCWSRSCSHWDPTGGNMVNQVNVEGIGVYSMFHLVCNIWWQCNSRSYKDNQILKKITER